MLLSEVMNQIQAINKYLSKCKWMDFDFVKISYDTIKIIGSIDLSWEDYHSVEIEFHEVEYISSLLFGFSLSEDKLFIELEDKSAFSLERGVLLAEDDYCFKINIEDFEHCPTIIIAKNIKFTVLKQPGEGM